MKVYNKQHEIDRKVSFMMAWHPRLGEYSIVNQYISKDVAKIIADKIEYIPKFILKVLVKSNINLLNLIIERELKILMDIVNFVETMEYMIMNI
jgi:hypothetical protein